MDFKKFITEDGEEINIPIINVGDIVDITMDDRDDEDLYNWLNEYKGFLIVSNVDYNDFMINLEHCDYAISMDLVSDIKEGFY